MNAQDVKPQNDVTTVEIIREDYDKKIFTDPLVENVDGIVRLKDPTKKFETHYPSHGQGSRNFYECLKGGRRFTWIAQRQAFNEGWTFNTNTNTWILRRLISAQR
jgi:hypothetical protein